MASFLVCLLALVAVGAAYGPPEPAYGPPEPTYGPPPTPEPVRCFSKYRSKHFDIGKKWTDEGCQKAECVGGQTRLTPCPGVVAEDAKRPLARCRLVDGAADAEYPSCCPRAVCDRCYSTELDRVFDHGQVWTEPGCKQYTCDKGDARLVESCPALKLQAGCRLEQGIIGGEYPACCPQPVCPRPDQCYSEERDHVFNDGQVWTESGCTQVTCVKGEPVPLHCGPVAVKPGCEILEGPADADHPDCCPQMRCTTTTSTTTAAPAPNPYY